MKLSAMQRAWWRSPLMQGCKKGLLLGVLTLFSTVHLMAAAPPDEVSGESGLSEANCNSQNSDDLQATAESTESGHSPDFALRELATGNERTVYRLATYSAPNRGSKRYWQPGANGPPAHTLIQPFNP